jgi:hypothetical protein
MGKLQRIGRIAGRIAEADEDVNKSDDACYPDYQRAIGLITIRNALYSYGNTLGLRSIGATESKEEMPK